MVLEFDGNSGPTESTVAENVTSKSCSTEMDAFIEASAMQWVILSAPPLPNDISPLQSSHRKNAIGVSQNIAS
ncbi:hypothetical protein CEXT_808561 [Caerostris extrusa]|uniref:Uncharacterized protein n=1 Tax=Caerostris extrusa TaxID=172846 RepID=A0AAV4SUN2_CAEEX|nr:hypothetical protein CEXT_808561 [Caerostris extrusa]